MTNEIVNGNNKSMYIYIERESTEYFIVELFAPRCM